MNTSLDQESQPVLDIVITKGSAVIGCLAILFNALILIYIGRFQRKKSNTLHIQLLFVSTVDCASGFIMFLIQLPSVETYNDAVLCSVLITVNLSTQIISKCNILCICIQRYIFARNIQRNVPVWRRKHTLTIVLVNVTIGILAVLFFRFNNELKFPPYDESFCTFTVVFIEESFLAVGANFMISIVIVMASNVTCFLTMWKLRSYVIHGSQGQSGLPAVRNADRVAVDVRKEEADKPQVNIDQSTATSLSMGQSSSHPISSYSAQASSSTSAPSTQQCCSQQSTSKQKQTLSLAAEEPGNQLIDIETTNVHKASIYQPVRAKVSADQSSTNHLTTKSSRGILSGPQALPKEHSGLLNQTEHAKEQSSTSTAALTVYQAEQANIQQGKLQPSLTTPASSGTTTSNSGTSGILQTVKKRSQHAIVTIAILLISFTLSYIPFMYVLLSLLTGNIPEPNTGRLCFLVIYVPCLVNPLLVVTRTKEIRRMLTEDLTRIRRQLLDRLGV